MSVTRIGYKFLMSAATIGATAVLLSACSTEAKTLHGYVPPSPKIVNDVSVHESGASEPMAFAASSGEMLVVYFGYTNCPDMCPTTMVALKNAKKKIGELATRVDLAMVTVDPDRDTDEKLFRYLSSFSDKYHALVPQSAEELIVAKDAFQASSSITTTNGKIEVAHSGSAYVVNDAGAVVVEWPFGLDAVSMANDLTILLLQKGK
jgi:protein SCO1/2